MIFTKFGIILKVRRGPPCEKVAMGILIHHLPSFKDLAPDNSQESGPQPRLRATCTLPPSSKGSRWAVLVLVLQLGIYLQAKSASLVDHL